MDDQALKWWHVRWGLAGRMIARFAIPSGKIIAVVCLVAAAGWGGLYLLQPWLISLRIGKVDPRLSIVPIGLADSAEAMAV